MVCAEQNGSTGGEVGNSLVKLLAIRLGQQKTLTKSLVIRSLLRVKWALVPVPMNFAVKG